MVDGPGYVLIDLTLGRRFRIPFSILSLIGISAQIGILRLRGHLLFAAVFPLKLLPQFALNAGVRRHDFTIRLCQSI